MLQNYGFQKYYLLVKLLRRFTYSSEFVRQIVLEGQKYVSSGDFDKALVRYEYAAMLGNKEATFNAAYIFENNLLKNASFFEQELVFYCRSVYSIFCFILIF